MSATTSTDPSTLANSFAITSDVWKPRLRVTLGNQGVHDPTADPNIEVTTALSAMVQKSNWYQADRHKITFALWGDQKFGYNFWAPDTGNGGFDTMTIKVEIGWEGVLAFKEVFRGFTDKVIIDPIKGIVTVTGRNVLGLLVDSRSIDFSHAQTVWDFITTIFTAAKLKDPVADPSFEAVQGESFGREFLEEISYGSLSDRSILNPMDLLMGICQQVGGTMYEDAGVVHFTLEINDDTTAAFIIQAPVPDYSQQPGLTKLGLSNVTSLTIEHDLNISQWDWVMISVNSENTGKATQEKWPTDTDPNADTSKPYLLHSANKNADATKTYPKSMFQEFMMHELIVTAKVAGPQLMDLKLNQKIAIAGTSNDAMDGWYSIDSIEHQIDFHKGYVGTVKGRYGRFDKAS